MTEATEHEFTSLSDAGQFRRMRRLAENALAEHWNVHDASLRPLRHGENTTFRVDRANGERLVLRIHRHGYQADSAIRSELEWLTALGRDTDLIVPQPRPTAGGDPLGTASHHLVPHPRVCTLLTWTPGRFLDVRLTGSKLRLVGQLLAELHNHAERFISPSNGFDRPRWDRVGLLHNEAFWGSPFDAPLTDVECDQLAEALPLLDSRLRQLDATSNSRGLVHADLHQANYLFHGSRVNAIDFDDCGFSYWLYDLAVTLIPLQGRPNYVDLERALLDGYRNRREIAAEQWSYLQDLLVVRCVLVMAWTALRGTESANIASALEATTRHSALLVREWLTSQ